MVNYPAIFKLAGQDELIYLADQYSFDQQYQLQKSYLTADDLLIDATGRGYLLERFKHDMSSLPQQLRQFELSELTALVQAHFFALAQSCVVKIQASSITGLYHLLAESEEA